MIQRCQFCFELSAELVEVEVGALTIGASTPKDGKISIDYALNLDAPHAWFACPECLPLAAARQIEALWERCWQGIGRAVALESGLTGAPVVLEHDDFWPHSLRSVMFRAALPKLGRWFAPD